MFRHLLTPPTLCLYRLHVVQLGCGFPIGFFFCCAAAEQFLVTVLQVLGEFLSELRLRGWLETQRCDPFSNEFFPIRHAQFL